MSAVLPPPQSGQFLEVSFRRLLKSCEEIMAGDSKGRADLQDWRSSPVFHHYEETLQEQLTDLESSTANRVDEKVLQLYRQHVKAISSQLQAPDLPAYCQRLPKVRHGVSKMKASTSAPAVSYKFPEASTSEASLRQRAGKAGAAHLDANTQELIDRQRHLQDHLSDELAGMAAGLVKNARATQGAVEDRGSLLDETETAIDRSLAGAKVASTMSKTQHKRGARSFCATCLVLMVMGFIFIGTYMVIVTTRMAGYKAQRAG
ncbi:hypothetical protein WJX72_005165 [[Myrmecia] bisecta]|uniref:Uncharacterized protein n=1 Tax=[Myrmecia] bisecta TaxID=41462 RepID=A0AAW1QRC1_9CHLO